MVNRLCWKVAHLPQLPEEKRNRIMPMRRKADISVLDVIEDDSHLPTFFRAMSCADQVPRIHPEAPDEYRLVILCFPPMKHQIAGVGDVHQG